jgi:chromosome segregation ATPase
MMSGSDEAAAIALERQIATAVERTRAEFNGKLASQKEEHQKALAEIEGNRSGKFHKEMTAVVANVRAELEADAEKLRKEIAALKGERDQAKMQLADLQNEHSHCSKGAEHASANVQLQAEVTRMREELSHAEQLVSEYEQLAAEREQTNKLLSEAVDKNRQTLSETQKTASETAKRELEKLREAWDSERSKFTSECSSAIAERDRFKQELDRATAAAAQVERQREQLQKDLDEAMEVMNEVTWPNATGDGMNIDLIREETARVEQSLQAIIKAIEDPNAELSFVVRKNVERAQLDSYLQGLRFAAANK